MIQPGVARAQNVTNGTVVVRHDDGLRRAVAVEIGLAHQLDVVAGAGDRPADR